MNRRKIGLGAAVLLAVLAFAAGIAAGSLWFVDVVRTPCWQVESDLQPARDKLSETFGAGEDGAEALATLREASRDRPDCFDPSSRRLYNLNPTDAGTSGAPAIPSEFPSG